MTDKEAKELLIKYAAGQCTEEEKALLHAWYLSYAKDSSISLSEEEIELAVKEIWETLPAQDRHKRRTRVRYMVRAAAAVVIFAAAALYLFLPGSSHKPASQGIYADDIAPGGNKAILTLADGSKINLSDAHLGHLDKTGPVKIVKAKDGQIVYDKPRQAASKLQIAYNLVTTPRGGQYQVILPDGSLAWLNAASSIRFPTEFSGQTRKVEISGEVYFEVAKKMDRATGKRQPFIVGTNSQQVEVLGTHFNINAYGNEDATRTTLLEGSVKISALPSKATRILKPGQQSAVSAAGLQIASADTALAIAWKNGEFQFDQADIKDVMRQAERWYNVDVEYQGMPKGKKFVGTISRNLPASKFLNILSYTGVKFKIEGKKIIVFP
ncbi:MAG TPA: FecR domain-containing protein [Chitinophagaceae bacterium]